jgi:hypothetical protein
VPTGANLTVAFAQVGRILAALGAGRHADAYELTQRLFDPASHTHHLVIACWLIGELAEAALHTGRHLLAPARGCKRWTGTSLHPSQMSCLSHPGPRVMN